MQQEPEVVETPDEDVAARSVRPVPDGERSNAVPCPNCGSSRVENYCARCGQRAGDDLHVSVRAFAREALDGLFSFDSRIWNTLFTLLRRPGHLTVEHWRGRRARYVAPLRLYLLASLFDLFIANTLLDLRGDLQTRFDTTAESPERAVDFFFQGASWMFLFLLPVFAAVLRLLYRRREPFFVPHLVFAVHFFTAGFVISIATTATTALAALFAPLSDLVSALLFWPVFLVLLFLSLRRAYGEPPMRTLAKQACLTAVSLVLLGLLLRLVTIIALFAGGG